MDIPVSNWQFWAVMSAVFAALTALFAKVGVETVDPDLATLIRTLIIAVILALMVGVGGKFVALDTVTPKAWVFLSLSALATGASWLCYFRALKLGPASLVAPVDKMSVVLVAVLAFVFLGERPSGLNWLGLLMISGGLVLVIVRR
jgi:transporter family protein